MSKTTASSRAGYGCNVLLAKGGDVLEDLTLVQKISDTMGVASHLVHVVRNPANDTVQIIELLHDFGGKLSATLKGCKRSLLEQCRGGNSVARGQFRNTAILRQRQSQVHALRVVLVGLSVVSEVVATCHLAELKANWVQRETRRERYFPCRGMQGVEAPAKRRVRNEHAILHPS